jgi:hypothetical protein
MDGGGCRQRLQNAGMSGALRCLEQAATPMSSKHMEAVA